MYNKTIEGKQVYILAIKPLHEDNLFVLGTPFLNRVYTVLDFDNNQLGLSSIYAMNDKVKQGFATVIISAVAGVAFIIIISLICFCLVKRRGVYYDQSLVGGTMPEMSQEQEFEVDNKGKEILS